MSELSIQRLNMDSSWLITWDGVSFVIDPWLIGSEVDGFKWLNEQWHLTEPLDIAKLPAYDAIIISNPYSDHCHVNTLQQLRHDVPLFATQASCKRLKREWKERTTTPIGYLHKGESTSFKDFKLTVLKPEGKWIDPIYHTLIISKGKDAICYASHGFKPSASQLAMLKDFDIHVLMTTFTWFKLPSIMGGLVNLGYEAACDLAAQLKAKHLLNTHDEQKPGKGLVLKLSQAKYTDTAKLNNPQFINLPDYTPVNLTLAS